MRRFVETRLLEGMSEDQIMHGLINGFGQRVMEDQQLVTLGRIGRTDLITGFVNGFGPAILVEEPGSPVWYLVMFAAFVVFIVAVLRLVSKKKSASSKESDSEANAVAEVDQRILNLDR